MQYCPEWSTLTLMGMVSQSKGHKESPSENNCAHLLWIFKSPDGKVCADRLYSSLLHGHESTKWGNIYFILFQVSNSTQFSFPLGDNFILSCKHSPVYACNYLVTQCTSSTKHKIQHTSPGLQLMSTSNIRVKTKSGLRHCSRDVSVDARWVSLSISQTADLLRFSQHESMADESAETTRSNHVSMDQHFKWMFPTSCRIYGIKHLGCFDSRWDWSM